jgi:hypothetical protein
LRAAEDFKIQRDSVVLAARRVDQARRLLDLPPPPGEPRELGVNAARDLLDAHEDLVESENLLVETWVDYHIARLELLRDMELLDVRDPASRCYLDLGATAGPELVPLPRPETQPADDETDPPLGGPQGGAPPMASAARRKSVHTSGFPILSLQR